MTDLLPETSQALETCAQNMQCQLVTHLGGEPSWWQNVLVVNCSDGESSKRRNYQHWGQNVHGANITTA